MDVTETTLRDALGTRWMGAHIVVLDETGSTNDDARELARQGAPHGTVVVAGAQRGGRGRVGRTWHSPAGNLYLSVVLRPDVTLVALPLLTLAGGVAVCDALNAAGCRASLKWPNDVLVRRKKIAGILTEAASTGRSLEFCVMGMGINVDETDFPAELADLATSVRRETGAQASRLELLVDVLTRLEERVEELVLGGPAATIAAWKERSAMLGGRVTVSDGDRRVTGVAVDLDEGGALLLDVEGTVRTIVSGEVRS